MLQNHHLLAPTMPAPLQCLDVLGVSLQTKTVASFVNVQVNIEINKHRTSNSHTFFCLLPLYALLLYYATKNLDFF